ncbi:hypothetical protein [Pedobacter heparinus]|uniref:hypothetical protein n=1 Tax=Pedobacter heparinus TaxID=984 RepID=UPI00292FEA5C|nr:hypothetical protein [Pedobacter heparinus]
MKKFILQIAKFSLVLLVLLVAGLLFTASYISNKSNFKIPDYADKIIIGHSHPECAFNDSLITNTINIAQSGESYFYSYYKVKQLLQQNKNIKYVFVEFTNNQIEKKMEEWIWSGLFLSYKYHTYAPFIDYQGNSLLMKNNPKSLLKLQIKTLLNNIKVILFKDYDYARKTGGYLYLGKSKTDSLIKLKDITIGKNEIHELLPIENLAYLDRIVNLCQIKGVKVILLRSPLHKKYPGIKNENEFKKLLTVKYRHIHFLDFKNFPLQDEEFADLEHLNFKGAKKFSAFFNDLLAHGLMDVPDQQKTIDRKISLAHFAVAK